MEFIDTHFHLDKCDDIEKYINNAKDNNVNRLIASCCNINDLNFYLNLLNKYSNLYLSLGIHPEYADDFNECDLNLLEDTVKNNKKIVAVGEIGLDYHYGKDNCNKQKKLFNYQLLIANKYNLPVVIHSRDATLDTYNILSKYNLKGVIHCFSGSYETASSYIKLGYYIGIGGVSTFKNSKLPDVIKKIGIGKIVLETDSPYLTPVPYRGKVNESKYIPIIANNLADILSLSLEKTAKITTENAISLFDL